MAGCALKNMNFLSTKCLFLLVGFLRSCLALVTIKHIGSSTIITPFGEMRGQLVEMPSYSRLNSVEVYNGLQFASISSSFLRFSTPNIPRERWESVRIFYATEIAACPQHISKQEDLQRHFPNGIVEKMRNISYFTKNTTEDCLRLNIHVPITRMELSACMAQQFGVLAKTNIVLNRFSYDELDWNNTSKLPVMVFVHGESYEIGTGNAYEGSVLASYGEVIVVTINYRLGVLGFLSTGDQEASGNYALWDLFAVLTWVNDNIGAFGGDKNRVTLFGHGYGAALVNILLLSPVVSTTSTRLFQRAILQSGSALSPWAISFDAVTCTQWLAVNVNCSQYLKNSKKLVKCLRSKTATELVEHVPLPPKYLSCFAPTPGNDQMFPQSIRELLKEKDTLFSQIPVMFGVTRNEAYSYLKQRDLVEGISKEKKAKMIRTFVHNLYKYNREKLYDILDFQYTEWNKEQNKNTTRDNVMDVLSDGLYVAPLVEMAQEHSKTGADTYFYNFGHSTQSEDFPKWSSGVHGDELPYVFGAPLVDGISPFPSRYTKNEKKLSEAVMRFWTNFAKSGNPNYPITDVNQDKFTDLHWPKYDIVKQRYLHIGKRPNIKDHYRGSELALWLDLIPKINTTPDEIKDNLQGPMKSPTNLSTFDDPDRLISNFRRIFPSSLIPTIEPINQNQNDGYLTKYPPYDKTFNTFTKSSTRQTSKEEVTHEGKDSTTEVVFMIPKKQESFPTDSIPLSITVAIGCSLLFINILICGGVYYQRERLKKIRKEKEAEAARHFQSRGDRKETAENKITSLPVNNIPQSSLHSKSDIPQNTINCDLEKKSDPPDNYAYTAVPTNTNSPLHLANSLASSVRSDHSINYISRKPPDRSPTNSDSSLNKKNRASGLCSNNAITIV